MLRSLFLLLLLATPCQAWNALGHKVIAEIAWETLSPVRQKEIADTLKRHPRYSEDFRDLESDQEIFQHAATWPDIARGIRGPDREKFDKPIWHYVNFPLGQQPKLNLSSDPQDNKSIAWNVMQATNFCLGVIKSDAPPQEKALAYSWILHLVGDAHQPMHSTALFSERFPKGDRGGNSIKLAKGRNLHSVWDNLLGRSHKPNDVKREVYQLKQQPELWEVDTTGNITDWIAESHKLAASFAYDGAILSALEQPGDIPPIVLPESYYKQAGEYAKARAVAAGLRLGTLLGGKQESASEDEFTLEREPRSPLATRPKASAPVSKPPTALTHWLNTSGGVRHNSTCHWYKNTKRGRECTADDGKPCGQCGG